MNRLFRLGVLVLMLMLLVSGSALAAQPKSKTLENSNTYEYENATIKIDQWYWDFGKTALRFFVADILTTSPDQLRTAFAGDAYSRSSVEGTSAIAERNGAILAVNGDYYNYKEDNGTVIRNGVLYRDKKSTRDHLLIDKDGNFSIVYKRDYEPGKGQEWIDNGVVQSLVFGPALVDGGELVAQPEKYAISTKDTQREPRVAIGQVDTNHYVFVIADGRRTDWSDKGMTLQELQQVCLEAGCRVAFNLDGGGSATMVLDGQRVNMGSTSRERDVSDIVYIGK